MIEDDDFVDDNAASNADVENSIDRLIIRASNLTYEIETLEAALKAARKELTQIVEKDLVERIYTLGTTIYRSRHLGYTVNIEKKLYSNEIKDPDKKHDLMSRRAQWLEANDGAALIKENIEITFDKGEHVECQELMRKLDKMGMPYNHDEAIHTGSFKSFVSDMISDGEVVPLQELGLYQKTEAVISLPKVKK